VTKRTKNDDTDPGETERLLLTIDAGFLARIEHEVAVQVRTSPKRRGARAVTRMQVIRDLIRESLDAHARERGEPVLMVEAAEPFAEEGAPEPAPLVTESGALALLDAQPDAPASAEDFEEPVAALYEAEHNPLSFDPVPVCTTTTTVEADNGLIQPSGLGTTTAEAFKPVHLGSGRLGSSSGDESDAGSKSGLGSGSGPSSSSATRPTIHLRPFGLRRKT
jgi:hypothetical protein